MSTGRILEHTNNGWHAFCYCGNKLNVRLFFGGLRAILQESEAKLEMKNFNPLQFFFGGRLPVGG